ncbi:glutamate-5-semialdehyde dehydrogenase [Zeaxanthinibacter enoshimensis]|uniref:Gamma-glutamyl phosphate reductase n=1 Tax=Zeaxanthinibacter enoshimensis TaxID=392009 RepID=A0A4R6TK51_9FLAO|nr:glutamate-5-semialdehyde dehydrogenase [Zeaxanthinibacter enoshimensis]TDQ31246.1 glutamate-5-semialdehyde dehydrogenase [Zeaxanthinibacter enoshimensis]
MKLLDTKKKNNVLKSMIRILGENRSELLGANKEDLDLFKRDDQAMYDRLVIDEAKIDGMIASVQSVMEQEDPVGKVISDREVHDGLKVINKTAPFGTIMIIYESRPDVTIEAAVLAFKANNKILLKGGKEAKHSNAMLVDFWHRALTENGLDKDWIQLMNMSREETQEFLKNPTQPLDLIVPRGGERLINFVKEHAECAVLVSGRGNNFLFIDEHADWDKTKQVILNAKTHKISACNALDKILVHSEFPEYEAKLKELHSFLKENGVEVLTDQRTNKILPETEVVTDESVWYEEFLAMKCVIGTVDSVDEAMDKINKYSGGHSATIMSDDQQKAVQFMEQVDSAAVYQNASTRFTDGGSMGVGAELAISTDKLHHRGPLGLNELVTNKYYVYGDGHVRA